MLTNWVTVQKSVKWLKELDEMATDGRDFLARAVSALGSSHGRVLAVEPSIADAHTGHGIVMPQCHHGGPGRAGNGAELGGLYGLRLYHQRVAVQGSTDLLAALQTSAAPAH